MPNKAVTSPLSLLGLNQQQQRDINGAALKPWQKDNNIEPSLDLKWGITPDLTLNATVNPDFSQVEADVAQLNVNESFSLFFPEKRSFFLDNADYFASNLNLIYTRNIAAPGAGAKLTGSKNGQWPHLSVTMSKQVTHTGWWVRQL